MDTTRHFELHMPSPLGRAKEQIKIQTAGPVVVVGANGCGKSRFGDWLEQQLGATVHRVAAQKSLTFPDSIRPPSIKAAQNSLWFGHEAVEDHKVNRWHNKPVTGLLDDYEAVLDLLFAEEGEQNANFRRIAKQTTERVEPPETKLDIVNGFGKRRYQSVNSLLVAAESKRAKNLPPVQYLTRPT
jgi:hypothetical protein